MESTRNCQTPEPALDMSAKDAAEAILKTAIEAHMRWKESLERYVEGADQEPRSLEAVASDDCCLLGQWLHTEGRTHFGQLKVFQALVRAHAEFHCEAAAILDLMHRGEGDKASQNLQMGDYPKASAQVKSLLARLYVEVLCQHPRPSRFHGYS